VQRLGRWMSVLAISFLFGVSARAQLALITFDRPFQTRNLAGVVVDSMGAPVSGVVIKDCVQTFRKPLIKSMF